MAHPNKAKADESRKDKLSRFTAGAASGEGRLEKAAHMRAANGNPARRLKGEEKSED